MRNLSSCLLALAAAISVPSIAHADDLFTLTNTTTHVVTTFTLPASPTPTSNSLNGYFSFTATVNYNGTPTSDGFSFYSVADGGAFSDHLFFPTVGNTYFFTGNNPQLYLPNEATPTFDLETTSLTASNGQTYSLTISSGTTPEPSSIALLGTGLLGIVGVARRRFNQ